MLVIFEVVKPAQGAGFRGKNKCESAVFSAISIVFYH